MTITANQIKAHVRDLIIQGTDIVPKTTLSANAVMGSLTATIVPLLNGLGRSRFVPNGRFTFFDALGEPTLTIATVSNDGATLTFQPSPGTGFTGLGATHPSGTVVYTNALASIASVNAQQMLARGDPVFFVTVTQVSYPMAQATPNVIWPPFVVHLQINRPLNPPDAATYDGDSWKEYVENQTNDDLDAIAAVLLAHEDLETDLAPGVALQYAPLNSTGDRIVTRMGAIPTKDGGGNHWTGTATLVVTAVGETLPTY